MLRLWLYNSDDLRPLETLLPAGGRGVAAGEAET